MRYDPEAVLQQASLDAASVAGFLSENYPQFVADGATDDLAAVAAYLSDAGGESGRAYFGPHLACARACGVV